MELLEKILENKEKISASISLLVAIFVLVVGYFQWWHITWNGKMITKKWVKVVFGVGIVLLIISGVLIFI